MKTATTTTETFDTTLAWPTENVPVIPQWEPASFQALFAPLAPYSFPSNAVPTMTHGFD
jgi:hypothetical protein